MPKLLKGLGIFWYIVLVKLPLFIGQIIYYIIVLLPLLAFLWKMPYRFIGWLWTARRYRPKWD